ncbi:methyl-accepting chemotaxis protein [Wukongibacter baidiensis]|uniref:methyl-accepting chemotaxis protein n=1 Tax=Wukongibacter baidiensis TaxID=1723361 RepID=UPI003D7FED9C
MKFKNWKIKSKIFSGFLILIVFIIILGSVSFISITGIVDQRIPLVENNERLTKLTLELRKNEKDFLLRERTNSEFFRTGKSKYLDKYEANFIEFQKTIEIFRKENAVISNPENLKKLDDIETFAQGYHNDFMQLVEQIRRRGFKNDGLLGELRNEIHSIESALENMPESENIQILMLKARRAEKDYFLRKDTNYLSALKEICYEFKNSLDGISDNEKDDLESFIDNYENKFEEIVAIDKKIGLKNTEGLTGSYRSKVHKLEPLIEELHENIQVLIQKDVVSLKTRVIVIIAAIILISIVIALYISNLITNPIKNMVKVVNVIASGDLKEKVTIDSKDEIGVLADNFNKMINNMKNLIKEMNDMGMTVSSTSEEMKFSTGEASKVSEQIATTICELAKGATEQTQSTQEGSNMINELIIGIDKIAKNTNKTEELTYQAKEIVDNGMNVVKYQKDKMIQNKEAANSVGNGVYALSEKSKQISGIVELISSIAEQTNLLALNAAIEAARAGEQGKGFSVVAEEVRKLAEESSRASKDIGEIINEITVEIDDIVKGVEGAKIIVDDQEDAVYQTSNSFQNILKAVSDVSDNIREISVSCKLLNEKSSIAGERINNIAAITEENAAGTEEVAASMEEQTASIEEISASADQLAHISNELLQSILRFKI